MKDLDQWNQQKKKIENRDASRLFFNEREVWWCILGVNVGVEEDGKQIGEEAWFLRPALILRKFNGKMVYILPITSEIKDDPYHFILDFRNRKSSAILSQGRLISSKRLFRRIHKISSQDFAACKAKFVQIFS